MAQPLNLADAQIGDTLSFNTYGVGVNNVVNGVLEGVTLGNSLRNPQLASVNHANVYSALPSNPPVPNDYTKYRYWLLRLTDDSLIEIGVPWIDPTSLTRLQRQTCTVVIPDVDPSVQTAILNLLNVNGYPPSSISFS